MKSVSNSFRVQSTGMRPTFHTVTEQVKDILAETGVQSGICVVFSRHTTCAVLIDEDSFDRAYSGLTYLQQDLTDVFEKIIPTCRTEGQYLHPGPKHIQAAAGRNEEAFWSLNTDAHLRSVLLGRSVTIPVVNGEMTLGEFGRIYFADFDQVRARQRTVRVQIVGE